MGPGPGPWKCQARHGGVTENRLFDLVRYAGRPLSLVRRERVGPLGLWVRVGACGLVSLPPTVVPARCLRPRSIQSSREIACTASPPAPKCVQKTCGDAKL
eukprot:7026914-Prymnesium_polylepis.2